MPNRSPLVISVRGATIYVNGPKCTSETLRSLGLTCEHPKRTTSSSTASTSSSTPLTCETSASRSVSDSQPSCNADIDNHVDSVETNIQTDSVIQCEAGMQHESNVQCDAGVQTDDELLEIDVTAIKDAMAHQQQQMLQETLAQQTQLPTSQLQQQFADYK
eukprot:TRINITY_DN124695_c0_g1_i1.p1 TRINITY_DN124695_c0_g1~~TRINITY_DN124695_c0_g1_i1.p1  ORF type:complete len:161 (-),score=36.37 TRINITY_DN124695_c0_g1_i1:297-779(-)